MDAAKWEAQVGDEWHRMMAVVLSRRQERWTRLRALVLATEAAPDCVTASELDMMLEILG